MEKSKVFFIGMLMLVIGLGTVNLQANPNGPNNNWTGSPTNSENCTYCHSTYPVNSGAGSITVSGIPASYTPGTTYPLTLTVADPQAMRWGFQVTALDPASQTAGALSVSDPVNTQLNPFLPIDVIMHNLTGTYAGTPTSGSWDFDWTAPVSGDDVTFWFAGNAANNNGFPTGDYIYTDTIMVSAAAAPALWISMTPLGSTTIPSTGGDLDYNITAGNDSTSSVIVDIWVDVTLPNSAIFGPVLGPVQNFNMPSGFSTGRDRVLAVPAGAPAGNYVLNGYLGDYNPPNSVIYAEDHFNFSKSGADDLSGLGDFMLVDSGEPFDSDTAFDMVPDEFHMIGNYPNPFNPSTVLAFNLPATAYVNLAVYDVSGRQVATLVDGWRDAGHHDVTFDASNLPSGVYLYTLSAGEFQASGKMVLMK